MPYNVDKNLAQKNLFVLSRVWYSHNNDAMAPTNTEVLACLHLASPIHFHHLLQSGSLLILIPNRLVLEEAEKDFREILERQLQEAWR